ncbi:MAG: hypothetical protein AAGA54_32460 [Myxococcota bacterium]
MSEPVAMLVGLRSPGENPKASVARAKGVLALIEGDREAWVETATEYGGLADIEAFLQDQNRMHGWDCFVSEVDGEEDEDAASSVLGFQREFNQRFAGNLLEDGICGTKTLGSVFDVLRDAWAKWLHKHGLGDEDISRVTWLAHDEALAVPSRGSGGLDIWTLERAAFEGGDVDAARVGESRCTVWTRFDVPVEPWSWAAGPFTIVTDVPAGEVIPREEYTLRSDDGSFDMTLAIPDDTLDEGLQTLRFHALPADKSYSLTVRVHDGEPQVLFEGVPYNRLHSIWREGTE